MKEKKLSEYSLVELRNEFERRGRSEGIEPLNFLRSFCGVLKKNERRARKIYLAGKISQGDWRREIVHGLRNGCSMEAEDYFDCDFGLEREKRRNWETLEYSIFDEHHYVGPYFVSCDHDYGCFHGETQHGCGLYDGGCVGGGHISTKRRLVFELCLKAIQKCDLFFAWLDSTDCYGTIAEVGHAYSLGKEIFIAGSEKFWEMWFVYEMATKTNFEDRTAKIALERFLYEQQGMSKKSSFETIKFITRYPGRNFSREGICSNLHVTEQAVVAGLPDWRKMPYCRNGGLDLSNWSFVELNPKRVAPSQVCGNCLNRLKAHKQELDLGSDL